MISHSNLFILDLFYNIKYCSYCVVTVNKLIWGTLSLLNKYILPGKIATKSGAIN